MARWWPFLLRKIKMTVIDLLLQNQKNYSQVAIEGCHFLTECTKHQGRNRHIFLRGQSHFSWFFSRREMLFPGRKFPFCRPKTNFCRFQKWKAKKKKGPHLFFWRFPASISNFPPFLLNFHPFSLFSLPLFSRYVSKNFPVRSLWGSLCPPACYATAKHCRLLK